MLRIPGRVCPSWRTGSSVFMCSSCCSVKVVLLFFFCPWLCCHYFSAELGIWHFYFWLAFRQDCRLPGTSKQDQMLQHRTSPLPSLLQLSETDLWLATSGRVLGKWAYAFLFTAIMGAVQCRHHSVSVGNGGRFPARSLAMGKGGGHIFKEFWLFG